MKQTEFYSGAVICGLALGTIFWVIPWQIEEVGEGYVSPRLLPQICMWLIAGLCALQAVNGLRGIQSSGVTPIRRAEIFTFLKLGAVLALSLALFVWVAPLAAGISLIAGAFLVLGERNPLVILGVTGGLLLLIWGVFYRLLGTAIV
ncbi:MAG: hypothetical protein GYB53_03655 [Rhodobacteraceae bacterium]|nr:hypothetical protein [Paracoccaceae bacterium]MBR9822858.1 hypothetical protein [Paracoccaceae bacterium]